MDILYGNCGNGGACLSLLARGNLSSPCKGASLGFDDELARSSTAIAGRITSPATGSIRHKRAGVIAPV
jgi:hypothetical protein